MSHRCCPKGTIGPVKDKEFLLMKYLESNTMWLPNKVYIGRMPKIIDDIEAKRKLWNRLSSRPLRKDSSMTSSF